MTKPEFGSMNVPTAADGTGTASDVSHLAKVAVFVAGTFSASVSVQVSADGSTWATYGAAITTPTVREIAVPVKQVRVVVASWASGQPVASYGGNAS